MMGIRDYETAIATFRRVLAGVTPEQRVAATPCASFDVAELIDHTIGTQHMVTDALQDKPFNMTGVELARSAASRSLRPSRSRRRRRTRPRRCDGQGRDPAVRNVLRREADGPRGAGHVPTRMGPRKGHRAGHRSRRGSGGSSTVLAVAHMADVPRGEEPAPYGPERTAPAGAPAADRLAAFLGRDVIESPTRRVRRPRRTRRDLPPEYPASARYSAGNNGDRAAVTAASTRSQIEKANAWPLSELSSTTREAPYPPSRSSHGTAPKMPGRGIDRCRHRSPIRSRSPANLNGVSVSRWPSAPRWGANGAESGVAVGDQPGRAGAERRRRDHRRPGTDLLGQRMRCSETAEIHRREGTGTDRATRAEPLPPRGDARNGEDGASEGPNLGSRGRRDSRQSDLQRRWVPWESSRRRPYVPLDRVHPRPTERREAPSTGVPPARHRHRRHAGGGHRPRRPGQAGRPTSTPRSACGCPRTTRGRGRPRTDPTGCHRATPTVRSAPISTNSACSTTGSPATVTQLQSSLDRSPIRAHPTGVALCDHDTTVPLRAVESTAWSARRKPAVSPQGGGCTSTK